MTTPVTITDGAQLTLSDADPRTGIASLTVTSAGAASYLCLGIRDMVRLIEAVSTLGSGYLADLPIFTIDGGVIRAVSTSRDRLIIEINHPDWSSTRTVQLYLTEAGRVQMSRLIACAAEIIDANL